MEECPGISSGREYPFFVYAVLYTIFRDDKIAVYGKRLTSRNSFVIKSKS